MIQRIQTIWFILASIALFCLFLFPYLQVHSAGGVPQVIKVTGVYETVNGQAVQKREFDSLIVGTVVIALLPLLLIFYYKNRKKQILMSYAVIIAIIAYGFWLVRVAKSVIGNVKMDLSEYGMGVILPSVAILLIILALKGIRNDEKLVRSADRLR